MKKRDIIIDLTAFLDVILIIMFLVLTQNTGELAAYRLHAEDMETRATLAEELREDAEYRLSAVADWDNDRTRMLGELDALQQWRDIVENAVFFISVDMHISGENRFINVISGGGMAHTIEVRWASFVNAITNEAAVLSELNAALAEHVAYNHGSHPVLVMVNYSGIARQEYALITRGIQSFTNAGNFRFEIYYSSFGS